MHDLLLTEFFLFIAFLFTLLLQVRQGPIKEHLRDCMELIA